MSLFKILIVALGLSAVSASEAQINASTQMTYTQTGSVFNYAISITNTGTTNLGTLWYAWLPGQDYLPLTPTSFSAPTGWKTTPIDGSGTFNGHSVQWTLNGGSLLAPGATLSGFGFSTTTTPNVLLGNFPGSTTPIGTSVIYEGAPFVGTSKTIFVNPVPEPSSLLALAGGAAALARRRKRRASSHL